MKISTSLQINLNCFIAITASIGFIVVPIGSLLSGWVTEPIGRKRSFFFVNIPHLLSWILLYRSTTYTHVFWAQILTGFGHGLMEAPLVTYIGEIVYDKLIKTVRCMCIK